MVMKRRRGVAKPRERAMTSDLELAAIRRVAYGGLPKRPKVSKDQLRAELEAMMTANPPVTKIPMKKIRL